MEAPLKEFAAAQEAIVLKERWIIEGNYNSTIDIRVKNADTIIYLELPLYVCLYRVVKRWLSNIGRSRPDMGEGWNEKLDWSFIKFICTTYYPRKKKMEERLKSFEKSGAKKKMIVLKNKEEIKSFLVKI